MWNYLKESTHDEPEEAARRESGKAGGGMAEEKRGSAARLASQSTGGLALAEGGGGAGMACGSMEAYDAGLLSMQKAQLEHKSLWVKKVINREIGRAHV